MTTSWDEYVEKQLLATKCVTRGCIAGLDGNVWATSEGFNPSQKELSTVVAGFDNTDVLTSNGFHLSGQRYIYLSGTDTSLRAKFGKVGVHCRKTQRAIVVALYEDPIQPQQAATVVEKLGDYLERCGY